MSNSHSRHAEQLLDGVMEVLRIAVAPGLRQELHDRQRNIQELVTLRNAVPLE